MKRILIIALGASICGAANAGIYGFAAPLINGAQEIPAVSSDVFGSGSFTLNDATWTLSGSYSLSNAVGWVFTANHIHLAPTVTPRSNGPVIFDIKPIIYSDVTVGANRVIGWSGVMGGTQAQRTTNLQALIAGRGYFNFHTTKNPGGEIRGDIHCSSVPEPSSYIAVGLGVAVLARKRRK